MKSKKSSIDWRKLISAIILCEATGILGSLFTAPAIPTWYAQLTKPSFAPPNWLFGPAWTILYLLMGISLYWILMKDTKKKPVRNAIFIFYVQLAVNFLWSPIFFGLQSPLLGLVTIVLLWSLILVTIEQFYPIDRQAAYLLYPYLTWVSFATVLNATILVLN